MVTFIISFASNCCKGISQTPQVYLDCQVYETDGALAISWDTIVGLFPEGMIDSMFHAFVTLIQQLSSDEWNSLNTVNLLPLQEKQTILSANATDVVYEKKDMLLHELFDSKAREDPSAIAVEAPGKVLTYGQIHNMASSIAHILRQKGVEPNQLVAIVMQKVIVV